MAKGRVYCRDKRGREVAWGRGRAWVDFSIQGPDGKSVRVRRPIDCQTKAEAEMELARLMTEKAAELRVKAPDAAFSELEVGPCFAAWCESRRHHPKAYSARNGEARVRRFVEWLDAKTPLESIGADLVAEFRDHRLSGPAPVLPQTARVDLSSISGFFAWCMEKPRRWIKANPVKEVKKPPMKKGRPEAIDDWSRVEEVIAAVQGHPVLEPAYRLAFSTVCREEIAIARWEDVDLKRGTLKIRDGKNSTRIGEIPLHEIALSWLRANRKPEGWIVEGIPRNNDRAERPWGEGLQNHRGRLNRARKKEGLPPLPGFHKGRHTIATALARDGAPLPIAQAMLRHSSPTTTARYYTGVRALDAAEHLRGIGNSSEGGSAATK